MTILSSDRFLRVLNGQPVDRTPAWLMRQAGRYLPEYREIRSSVKDFIELCQTPDLACEVTLQPLRRYPLDAAILFQDILTLPNAMGQPLKFVENEGPVFENPISTLKDVEQLKDIEPEEDMAYVGQAIDRICAELSGKLPLIGFCGSPWTVATYMTEGKLSKQFKTVRKMMVQAPEVLHALLRKLAENSVRYLQAQIRHGAQCVMIFDTWGGILPYQAFKTFTLDYMAMMVEMLQSDPQSSSTPIIVFTKQAGHRYADLARIKPTALGTDWTLPLSMIRKAVGDKIVLQGNLDPFILYGKDEVIRHEMATLLKDYGSNGGHIFNLGHGMMPDMEPEKVSVLLEALHTLSPSYHPMPSINEEGKHA
jgi:uroporphyrinogen decarboxylase